MTILALAAPTLALVLPVVVMLWPASKTEVTK